MREVFDIKFRNPLGATLTLESARKPFTLRRASLCSFIELGPISFMGEGGIKDTLNWIMGRSKPEDYHIALRLSKHPEITAEEQIRHNMLRSFSYAYDFADFFVLDFGREEMGAVQELDYIRAITDPILDARLGYEEFKPVILKITPRLGERELDQILDYCLMNGIDAVESADIQQIGKINAFSSSRLPIIGCITAADQVSVDAMLNAGASLVDIDAPHIFRAQLKHLLKSL